MAPHLRTETAWILLFLCSFAAQVYHSMSVTSSEPKGPAWFQSSCTASNNPDVRSVSGLEDMTVNLNVSCGRDVANLTATSGGLAVRALRLAQECSFLSLENGTNQTVLDYELDQFYGHTVQGETETRIPRLSPILPEHQPWQSDLECTYFGCYTSENVYDKNYYFTFSTVTCNFTQLHQVSSTAVILPSPSPSGDQSSGEYFRASATSETHHFRINSNSNSISLNYMSPAVLSTSIHMSQMVELVQLTRSVSNEVNRTVSHLSAGGANQTLLVLIIVIISIMVVGLLIVTSLFLFIKRFYRVTYKNAGDIYKETDIFDVGFFPVQVLKPSLTPSFSYLSITTKLDELHQSKSNLDTKAETDAHCQSYGDQIFEMLRSPTADELNLTDPVDFIDHTETAEEFDNHSEFEGDVVFSQKQNFPVPTSMANGSNSYIVAPLIISTDKDVDQQQEQLDHFCLDLDSESGSSLVEMEELDSKSEQLNGTSTVLQSSLSENHCHNMSVSDYHPAHIYSPNTAHKLSKSEYIPNSLEQMQQSQFPKETDLDHKNFRIYNCDNVVPVLQLDKTFLQEQQLELETSNMHTNRGYVICSDHGQLMDVCSDSI